MKEVQYDGGRGTSSGHVGISKMMGVWSQNLFDSLVKILRAVITMFFDMVPFNI